MRRLLCILIDRFSHVFIVAHSNWCPKKLNVILLGLGRSVVVVCLDRVHSVRIPDKASIFTAEIRALQLALTIIKISIRRKFVICIDSFLSSKVYMVC